MSIRNFELRIRHVDLNELSVPYGQSIQEPADVVAAAQALIGRSTQEHFLTFFL